MGRLRDKVILITGAAGGIGSAIAEAVVRNGGIAIASDLDSRPGIPKPIDDESIGASGSVQGAWKFGAGGRLIRVHKRLVEASARTGGAERDRFDCAPT